MTAEVAVYTDHWHQVGEAGPAVVRPAIANSEIANACSVAELVDALDLPAPVTLVEHNGFALRREEWTGRALAEGDRIEIIRIVAGG